MSLPGPEAAEVDRVLELIQSADNQLRSRAEAQLEAWCLQPAFFPQLMARSLHAPTPASRQLAATLLTWRLPRLWATLSEPDQRALQAALLECFTMCQEPAVLRALGEVCNGLSQSIALHRDMIWEELLRLVGARLGTDGSPAQRKAAIDLLASLVDALGARLHQHYPEIGMGLSVRIRDTDPLIQVAALNAVAVVVSSWCLTEKDLSHWRGAADAAVEVAVAALGAPPRDAVAPKVLAAALKAVSKLAPVLGSEALVSAAVELACRVLALENAPRVAESSRAQALQVLKALVCTGSSGPATQQVVAAAVHAACRAAKDAAPSVDDLDEVSVPAQAGRDCLRALARAAPGATLPLIFEAARVSSLSADAMDRAAAVHMVIFGLCGAREAPAGWALPLARWLSEDAAVWVRQAVLEGVTMLAETLRPAPSTTEGLLIMLRAISALLKQGQQPELVRKAADAAAAIFLELSSDEAQGLLPETAPALLQALAATTSGAAVLLRAAGQDPGSPQGAAVVAAGAVVSLASALAAAANSAADHFAPFAEDVANALLPLVRDWPPVNGVGGSVATSGAAVAAAALDASGAVVASAWNRPSLQATRDELAILARRVLAQPGADAEVRASAHRFFSRIAMASFEEFAAFLPQVIPAAVEVLQVRDEAEVVKGLRRRAVNTNCQEERVAATEALGTYCSAVGAQFAPFLSTALPAVCSQAGHASAKVRSAAARSLAQMGRVLGALAQGLPEGHPDRLSAAAMSQALLSALCELLRAGGCEGASSAQRSALQAAEDLAEEDAFLRLAGPGATSALASAVGGRRSEEIESSEDEEDFDQDDG